MILVDQVVKLPKELSEVKFCLVELVADIAAKKDLALIVSENLPNLIKAVEGFDQMAEEIKAPEAANVAALLGAEVFQALKKKEV